MLRAYFDTSVPSGIVDAKVPADEIAALSAAFARKDIIAPIGPVILDELFGELEIDRAAMIRKLAVLRQFDAFRGLLKMPSDMLKEAIEAYAAGVEPPPVMVPEADRRTAVKVMAEVMAGSRRYDGDLKAAVGGVDRLKNSWLEDMLGGQRKFLTDPGWVQIEPQVRREISFAHYFASSAPDMAVAHAESHGCADACRDRGVDGLLRVPSVRLCVGVALSQIYAQVFGTHGQPDLRRPDRGDGYDIWHAILASTADVFVTFDRRLADHIERIPDVENVRVLRTVKALLACMD